MFNLKAKLIALGAFLLTAVAFVLRLKFVTNQRDRLKTKNKKLKSQVNEVQDIAEADEEINNEFSDLHREAINDVREGEMPDNIRNRNDF